MSNESENPEPTTEAAVEPKAEEQQETKVEIVKSAPTRVQGPQPMGDLQFKEMIEKALPTIGKIISKNLTPERLVKIALVARQKVPKLRQCTPQSFLLALIEAAEYGLEPNTPHQHAVLIPYDNRKTGRTEAQFQPMWRGLVYLAREEGNLKTARARIVYERDRFKIVEGLHRTIEHEPYLEADAGKAILCYAVAEMKDGSVEWDYMTAAQIEAIRRRSKSANDGPWVDHPMEMWKKTVIKRLMKQIPVGTKAAAAIARDDDEDMTEIVTDEAMTSFMGDDVEKLSAGPVDKGSEIAQKIRGKKAAPQRTLLE